MTAISFFFLLETALKLQLLKISLTFEKLKYNQAMKFEAARIHFLGEVFAAVAVVVA